MNITSFLEVGTWTGWTGLFISAYLKQASTVKAFHSAGVDVEDNRNACVKRISELLRVSSMHLRRKGHIENTLRDMPEQIDLCFIDGDHKYDGVHKDVKELMTRCK